MGHAETTTDSQRLRFGFYQVRKRGRLIEEGFFYAEDLPESDLECLRGIVAQNPKLRLLTVSQFREWVFWRIAYKRRANIIGFNLPFDLSRLALDHQPARGDTMRG